jgi:hypothetical protein
MSDVADDPTIRAATEAEPANPPFFMQVRRSPGGKEFVLEAGWDTIKPPAIYRIYGEDGRIGRALRMIETAIGTRPADTPSREQPCSEG